MLRDGATERSDEELLMLFSFGGRGGGGMRAEGAATGAAESVGGAAGGAAPLTRAIAAADAGGEDERERDGTEMVDGAAWALGVVCGDASLEVRLDFVILGGGGGIAVGLALKPGIGDGADAPGACEVLPWLSAPFVAVDSPDGCGFEVCSI